MVIGKGDIASVLTDREGAVFFASGVSNSLCTDPKEFAREVDLLSRQPRDKCLFYFSTISIYLKHSPYTQHKLRMEQLIRLTFDNYNIIRVGNITWGNNPNTFLNYLRNRISNGDPYQIRDEYKYMIEKEQLTLLTNNLPLTGKNEINVFGEMKKVTDIIYKLKIVK